MSGQYKVDFAQKLVNFDGVALRVGLSPEVGQVLNELGSTLEGDPRDKLGKKLDEMFGKELTLGKAVIDSLHAGFEDEKNLGHEEKRRRFQLSRAVSRGKPFNVTERDLMKEVVRKNYRGALIYGLIEEMLENAEKVVEAPEIKPAV